MCYQAFITFACGHQTIAETPCAYALSQPPTFVKFWCADYEWERKYSQWLCGTGRFYCRHADEDGPFLDRCYDEVKAAERESAELENKLALLKEKAAIFTTMADRHEVPQEVREAHPVHQSLTAIHTNLTQRQTQVKANYTHATQIIEKARAFFQWRRELLSNRTGGWEADSSQNTFVPSQPGFDRLPLELQPATPPRALGPRIPEATASAATAEQLTVPAGYEDLVRRENSAMNPLAADGPATKPQRRDSVHPTAAESQAIQVHTPQKPKLVHTPSENNDSVIESHSNSLLIPQNATKRGSRRGKAAPANQMLSTPLEQGGKIRRSTRVRTKKMSYAESQRSDFSRDSSPVKAGSSPEKSDWAPSASPSPEASSRRTSKQPSKSQQGSTSKDEYAKRHNNGESLASKIGEWKHRTGNADTSLLKDSTAQPTDVTTTETAPDHQPATTDTVAAVTKANKKKKIVLKTGDYVRANRVASALGDRRPARVSPFAPFKASGVLGEAFPDTSGTAAVVGPQNLFNMYARQSVPAMNERPQLAPPACNQSGFGYWQGQLPPTQYPHPGAVLSKDPVYHSHEVPRASGYGRAIREGTLQSEQPYQQPIGYTNAAFVAPLDYASASSTFSYETPMQHQATGAQNGSSSDDTTVPYGQHENLPSVNLAGYWDYDSMRQSFNAGQNLSCANNLPHVTVTDTEPKKRKLPTSSPAPSSKRTRLSLPSHDERIANISGPGGFAFGGEDRVTMSSPAMMPRHRRECVLPPVAPYKILGSSPAPLMDPTSITYPHAPVAVMGERAPAMKTNYATYAPNQMMAAGGAGGSGNDGKAFITVPETEADNFELFQADDTADDTADDDLDGIDWSVVDGYDMEASNEQATQEESTS